MELDIYPKSFQISATNGKDVSTLEDFLAEMKNFEVAGREMLYRAPTKKESRKIFEYFHTCTGRLHKSIKSILRMPDSDSRLKDNLSNMINTSKELKIVLDELIRLNAGLVRLACFQSQAEDYLDVAFDKLLYVIPRYNPLIGAFSTFAVYAMKKDLQHAMKKDKSQHLVGEEMNPESLYDFAAQKPDVENLNEKVMAEILEKLVRGNGRKSILSPVEAEVIYSRYGFDGDGGRTLEAIGIKLGVTKERVRQIQLKTLNKLRDSLFTEFDRLTGREI